MIYYFFPQYYFALFFYSCNEPRFGIEDETKKLVTERILTSSSSCNSIFILTIQNVEEIEVKDNLKYGEALFLTDTCNDISYQLFNNAHYI